MTDFLARYMDPEVAGWLGLALIAGLVLLVLYVLIRAISGARERRHRAQNARISIVDVEEVDGRRRLVLVRRDEIEHLIMIGGANDLVIEGGIGQPVKEGVRQPARPTPAPRPVPAPKAVEAAPSPRPVPPSPAANVTPIAKPEVEPPAAPVVSAPLRPAATPVKPERKEPVLATSQPSPAPSDQGRREQLDGEIQELLAQMGQKPPSSTGG